MEGEGSRPAAGSSSAPVAKQRRSCSEIELLPTEEWVKKKRGEEETKEERKRRKDTREKGKKQERRGGNRMKKSMGGREETGEKIRDGDK